MNSQFQTDPRAIAAGMMLQASPTEEPKFTEAGLFAMVGAFAFKTDIDEETRLHNLGAFNRVLTVARELTAQRPVIWVIAGQLVLALPARPLFKQRQQFLLFGRSQRGGIQSHRRCTLSKGLAVALRRPGAVPCAQARQVRATHRRATSRF